jgi:formylglycine-generating enzyme required for sulfatase activity
MAQQFKIFVFFCFISLFAPLVFADERIALVIGNGAYKSSPLINPLNDAQAMASALEGLGFDVTKKENADLEAMNRAIDAFGSRLAADSIGLFYYAGHGMQSEGNNYLIPVNSGIEQENELRYRAVNAGLVLAKMESAKSKVNIIILDACRDNPFARSFRAKSSGLASMDAPAESLIAYATAPGTTARDKLYTPELIKQMKIPGRRLTEIFMNVRKKVKERSKGKQVPWESLSITEDFCFIPPCSATTSILPSSIATDPPGELLIKTQPSGAKIWIDGTETGITPTEIKMKPGKTTVRVGGISGYNDKEDEVLIEGGITTQLKIYLDKTPVFGSGSLLIETYPENAAVYADEKCIESSPAKLTDLNPGTEINIRASLDGYETQEKHIMLESGENRLSLVLEPKPGTVWKEPATGMEFIRLPKGCFPMGQSEPEKKYLAQHVGQNGYQAEAHSDELPRHEVCVNAFDMGKYEVTVGQWRKFIGEKKFKTDAEAENDGGAYIWTGSNWAKIAGKYWEQPGFEQNDSHPVTCLSWNDVQVFVQWLNEKNSGPYEFRLPAEAEWEYACRAGTDTFRFWGDDAHEACEYANVADRAAGNKLGWKIVHNCEDGYVYTAPAGKFKPNKFGLYDMLGNVWEYCEDIYSKDSPVADTGKAWRVVRGGGWFRRPVYIRCANRGGADPSKGFNNFGFRLVRIKKAEPQPES